MQVRQAKLSPPSSFLIVLVSEILDPGWVKIRDRRCLVFEIRDLKSEIRDG
jgi:hypothetical protein